MVTAQGDPGKTTELLQEAGNEDSSLGKFYNGTPLFVLERGPVWTKFRIGSAESFICGWSFLNACDMVYSTCLRMAHAITA